MLEPPRRLVFAVLQHCKIPARRVDFGARAVTARSGRATAKGREIPSAPVSTLPRRAGTGRAPLRLRLRRSVLQLGKLLARREDFSVVLQPSVPTGNCCRCPAPRPGGMPQEISRGQARASGRGPRLPRQTGHAPAGHRRSFWARPSRSFVATACRLGQVERSAMVRHLGPFLRCPAGAQSPASRLPGAAAAAADLPPANLLRRPSGTFVPPPSGTC